MQRDGARPRIGGSRIVWAALAVSLILGGGAYGWERSRQASLEDAQAKRSAQAAPAAVPVTLATASSADVPVLLDGLGTVQAYNTVVVRTRIDGQIDTVAFREGQMVNQGDVLVQIDPRPYQAALDGAQAKKTQDEASLANAKVDLERYTKLGSYATRQQLDTQGATVTQQTAQVAGDQATIDNARTQLSYATIRAPITGLAGFRLVDVGNIVNAATQTGIVTLTQLEPISVVFTAPEDQLPEINRALAAGTVEVAASSSDGSKVLSRGKLEIVNNQVDTASGTIRLKATFDNKDHALWPGLSVNTRTHVDTLSHVLTVPDTAVQHGPNGLFAYVVGDGDRAHVQRIAVGHSGDGQAVVTSGLSAGQRVVADGQFRVQEGVRVADKARPAAPQKVAAEAR